MTGVGPVTAVRPAPTVRSYRPDLPSDDADIAEICRRTGHAGKDARPHYRDPDLLPDVFTRPYLAAEPELAFVADDGGRVVGYLVGTASTAGFAAWCRDAWLPRVTGRHPRPGAGADPTSWDVIMARALHTPQRMVRPELAAYPAHLHINLLPEHQRQGLGRALMTAFLVALAERGVPAVHVAHGRYNISARVFYKRMGFTLLAVDDPDPVRYLGRPVPA